MSKKSVMRVTDTHYPVVFGGDVSSVSPSLTDLVLVMKPTAQHVIFVHRPIILDRWDRGSITNDLVDREFVSEHLIELALRGCSRPPFNEVTSGGFGQHLGKVGCGHDWNRPQA